MKKDVIDSAINKKYTAFSNTIKQELYNKMANHPESKAYADEYDKIQTMKQQFADITGTEDSTNSLDEE